MDLLGDFAINNLEGAGGTPGETPVMSDHEDGFTLFHEGKEDLEY